MRYPELPKTLQAIEEQSLERWREEILTQETRAREAQPKSAFEVLRKKLDKAVAAEEFEEAARQGAAAVMIVHRTGPAGYPWAVVETGWSGPNRSPLAILNNRL